MKITHTSQRSKTKKTQISTSRLNYDVKPLIKMALVREKSTRFCTKTDLLGKFLNSKQRLIKEELKEKIAKEGIPSLLEEVYSNKAYLHPVARNAVGKYLKKEKEISPELRKKVN